MRIKVEKEGLDGYFDCPCRSDLNSCQAVKQSGINSCPTTYDDEDGNMFYEFPEYCPLLIGDITISLN